MMSVSRNNRRLRNVDIVVYLFLSSLIVRLFFTSERNHTEAWWNDFLL